MEFYKTLLNQEGE